MFAAREESLARPRVETRARATRLLTSEHVAELADRPGLEVSLGDAHRAHATGRLVQPVPSPVRDPGDFGKDAAAIVPMSALDTSDDLFVMKVLADRPANRAKGMPAQQSTISVYDATRGSCVALIDGATLTRRRTAAATAVATRALARSDARTVTIVGAGMLAVEHALFLQLIPGIQEVRIWSRSLANAQLAAERATGKVPVVAVESLAAALRGADIVCTLTPAESPLLFAEHLVDGMHVNAVGSPPRPGYTEIDPAVFRHADLVVVDSAPIALAESGNIRNAIAAGDLRAEDLVQLGEALVHPGAGRTDDGQITIFNSIGLGLQDLAAARYVLRKAERLGIGDVVELR